jgi:hypothetical protein
MRLGRKYETRRTVRITAILAAAFMAACSLLAPRAAAAAAGPIRLQADRIRFYYDRYLVEADGHVRVRLANGVTMTGDTFSMDLKLNRFLIASHVHLRSAHGNLDGAAIADFLDFDRIYFVPVISEPDRWTYENDDFTKPLKGRIMPGDVFYFPNLSNAQVNYTAHAAVIDPKTYIRLERVRANFYGAFLPLPSFYFYFGENQDLAQNSLSGANFDATWNATGSAHDITAVHVRYDSFNKAYLAFEQHFAGNKQHEYFVASLNPATKTDKYWNAIGGERIGNKFEITTFSQLFTEQAWLNEPKASALTNYVYLVQAFPHSSLTSFYNRTNYNLIGPSAPASLNHPEYEQLTWTSFNNRVFHSPLDFQYREGFGYNHDAVTPLQDYGGYPYTTIWNHLFGFTFSLPNIKFGNPNKAYAQYYLNSTFDWQRQWFSVPHHYNIQSTNISLSRQFTRTFNSYLAYTIVNTSDIYNHGGYVPYTPTSTDGTVDYGYAAFRGASTQRTLTLGSTYSASPDLVTSLTFTHHRDFPAAVPNLFPLPPLNAIGQYIYTNYLGQPPWQLTGDVRARVLPHLVVDVQRTYYFHFGNDIWSPEFVVQFSQ